MTKKGQRLRKLIEKSDGHPRPFSVEAIAERWAKSAYAGIKSQLEWPPKLMPLDLTPGRPHRSPQRPSFIVISRFSANPTMQEKFNIRALEQLLGISLAGIEPRPVPGWPTRMMQISRTELLKRLKEAESDASSAKAAQAAKP